MTDQSIKNLKIAFRKWRQRKKHRTERVPDELMASARHAAASHGVEAVARHLGIERRHLQGLPAPRRSKRDVAAKLPGFSLLEITPPSAAQPLMEAEASTGAKLRVFQITPETIDLLSSIWRTGGGT